MAVDVKGTQPTTGPNAIIPAGRVDPSGASYRAARAPITDPAEPKKAFESTGLLALNPNYRAFIT